LFGSLENLSFLFGSMHVVFNNLITHISGNYKIIPDSYYIIGAAKHFAILVCVC